MKSASWASWQAAQEPPDRDDNEDERPPPSFVAIRVLWYEDVVFWNPELEQALVERVPVFRDFILGPWQRLYAEMWREVMAERHGGAWIEEVWE